MIDWEKVKIDIEKIVYNEVELEYMTTGDVEKCVIDYFKKLIKDNFELVAYGKPDRASGKFINWCLNQNQNQTISIYISKDNESKEP